MGFNLEEPMRDLLGLNLFDLARTAVEEFRKTFRASPTRLAIAPGRANLIGEHTDYHDGFVFPVAIDRFVVVAARPIEGQSDVRSLLLGKSQAWDNATVVPGDLAGWERYPAGVAWALREATQSVPVAVQALTASNLPIGAGLSSSAALEMAFATLWRDLSGLEVDDLLLAKVGQRAENEFVGMKCGIMDQTASIKGRAGQAMMIDTREPLSVDYSPLPEGIRIVICDTRQHHELASSGYNDRRAESEEAAARLGVNKLRDANLDRLIAAESEMPEVLVRRARHVITENARVNGFRRALLEGNKLAISTLMRASHESLRHDYEVTTDELNAMAEAAWDTVGCLGARMTGGGFGGACVALVSEGMVDGFIRQTSQRYRFKTGLDGAYHICRAVDGARVVNLEEDPEPPILNESSS